MYPPQITSALLLSLALSLSVLLPAPTSLALAAAAPTPNHSRFHSAAAALDPRDASPVEEIVPLHPPPYLPDTPAAIEALESPQEPQRGREDENAELVNSSSDNNDKLVGNTEAQHTDAEDEIKKKEKEKENEELKKRKPKKSLYTWPLLKTDVLDCCPKYAYNCADRKPLCHDGQKADVD
ncbi:unnamed protein product [Periconia digitata]|uniref:Uncharacterized protein n=1 Tax=Periconia digitata TaxID=1303443 RepID=A0A9W4XVY0_9PLEO|nr:unnamed protein product [Periconia digitata]